MTVDITPVRSPSRSKMPSARSRSCVDSIRSGPTGDARMIVSKSAPAANAASISVARPALISPVNHPRPRAVVDHPDLAEGGCEVAIVGQSLGQLDRAAIGFLGIVELELERGATERLAQRGAHECLTEFEGRPKLQRRVATLGCPGTDATGQLRGGILVVAHPQRRGAAELHIEFDRRIAHRLGEGGQLGQAIEPVAGPAQDRVRVVAGRKQDPAVGGR